MVDKKDSPETIDEQDLYEEIEDEELLEIINEEQQKSYKKERRAPRPPFPRWIFWLIALFMIVPILGGLLNTFSLSAIEFLKTSARLSQNEHIQEYSRSVVEIHAEQSRGTGFSISDDGYILTNYHVIETGNVSVSFPDDGLYKATIIKEFPEIDLALLKVDGENLPYLSLAEKTSFMDQEHIFFIGNPLTFTGIANEGTVLGYTSVTGLERDVLMIEAPIYRGNSGSPVINQAGEVIAVIYATTNTEEYGKVGLAVPITYFHEL
ncbi:S1C family serine protease [Salirhabdus salicampi]|uniref:S1C family serine protease n=1 Tax=Salirhabdus salicampi TaxID=476102 RepID=UPI0020C32675|nr:serine protease [Salirhabdus salicampi]MCP8615316.1 serine protease [Salirhabdus salicampi]